MTSLEIILSIVLVVVALLSIIAISNLRKESDEDFVLLCTERQKLYFIAQEGKLDSIFDVDNFNRWFNSPKDPDIYAHPGIFLRLDKLSQHHLGSYIEAETEGLLGYGDFNWETMKEFEADIRADWTNKLRE